MGSGTKSKAQVDMGFYAPSQNENDARRWCINNGIYISPKAFNTLEWYVCIVMNGKENKSPKTYKKVDIWKQVYLFYVYYYNKYNTDIKIQPMLEDKKKVVKEKQQSNTIQLF